jgi:hypothetical protein
VDLEVNPSFILVVVAFVCPVGLLNDDGRDTLLHALNTEPTHVLQVRHTSTTMYYFHCFILPFAKSLENWPTYKTKQNSTRMKITAWSEAAANYSKMEPVLKLCTHGLIHTETWTMSLVSSRWRMYG